MPQLGCFFYGELDGQGDRRINSLFPKHIIKKDGRISSIFTLTVSIHFYFFCQVIRRVFWVSQTHKPHPTNHFSCACACVCARFMLQQNVLKKIFEGPGVFLSCFASEAAPCWRPRICSRRWHKCLHPCQSSWGCKIQTKFPAFGFSLVHLRVKQKDGGSLILSSFPFLSVILTFQNILKNEKNAWIKTGFWFIMPILLCL